MTVLPKNRRQVTKHSHGTRNKYSSKASRLNLLVVVVLTACIGTYLLVAGHADAPIGTLQTANNPPEAIQQGTAVAYNGYLYQLDGAPPDSKAVYYSHIGSDGNLGPWAATTSLPEERSVATAVAYNGYVYQIGGSPDGTVTYYSHINSDGSLGSWQQAALLPDVGREATTVLYGSYVYVIGGYSTRGLTANIYYAHINSDGSLSPWGTTTGLPMAVQLATSVEYNGYLYEIGGLQNQSYLSEVYYSHINANGTLGAWRSTSRLPIAIAYSTAVVSGNRIYEIGGQNGGGFLNTIYSSQINSDGTTGPWTVIANLPYRESEMHAVVYNNHLYTLGGYNIGEPIDGKYGYSSSVYYTGVSGNTGPGGSGGNGSGTGTGSGGSGTGTNGLGIGNSHGTSSGGGSAGAGTATNKSTAPNSTPTPSPQGTQTKQPDPTPNPFYDGKQYPAGSDADSTAARAAAKRHTTWRWILIAIGVLIVLGSGLLILSKRRQRPTTKR